MSPSAWRVSPRLTRNPRLVVVVVSRSGERESVLVMLDSFGVATLSPEHLAEAVQRPRLRRPRGGLPGQGQRLSQRGKLPCLVAEQYLKEAHVVAGQAQSGEDTRPLEESLSTKGTCTASTGRCRNCCRPTSTPCRRPCGTTADDDTAYAAIGFGGQHIEVVPDLGLVVVVASADESSTASSEVYLDLVADYIAPAVRQ